MKKIFTILLMTLFLASQNAVFAAEKTEMKDTFENNYQTIEEDIKLSPIESMFNSESKDKVGNVLRQIGYNFVAPQSSANSTGLTLFIYMIDSATLVSSRAINSSNCSSSCFEFLNAV